MVITQITLRPMLSLQQRRIMKGLELRAQLLFHRLGLLRNPLHKPARAGDEDAIRFLLQHGVSCQYNDEQGLSALHLAIAYGHEKVTCLLLESGADSSQRVLSRSNDWITESRRQRDVLTEVLSPLHLEPTGQRYGALHTEMTGWTPVHLASATGCTSCIEALLATGTRADLHTGDSTMEEAILKAPRSRETALHIATRFGYEDIVAVIVAHRAEVDVKNEPLFQTALHLAAVFGNTAIAKVLLANGANPAALDALGETPAILAFECGHIETLSAILKAMKTQVGLAQERGRLLLHVLSKAHTTHANVNTNNVSILLQIGCDINAPFRSADERQGITPLLYALLTSDVEVVHELLRRGAKPNIIDPRFNEPLLHMLAGRLLAPSRYDYCRDGINPNSTAPYILTGTEQDEGSEIPALLFGVTSRTCPNPDVMDPAMGGLVVLGPRGKLGMLGILLRFFPRGQAAKQVDNRGRTALHRAVSVPTLDAVDVIDLLLSHGFDVNAQDIDGNTVAHLALHRLSGMCKVSPATQRLLIDIALRVLKAEPLVSIVNKDNVTLLIAALNTPPLWEVPTTIYYGSDIAWKDVHGKTALYYANLHGHQEAVKQLLRAEASSANVTK